MATGEEKNIHSDFFRDKYSYAAFIRRSPQFTMPQSIDHASTRQDPDTAHLEIWGQ